MEQNIQSQLGATVRLNADFEDVLAKTIDALKTEGFGVLTEIDIKETLKKKLNVDQLPYKILGACNPTLAHRALTAAPEVGLLLPCNVTVRQLQDGAIEVALVDPMTMLGVVDRSELKPIAEEAKERMNRVVQALQA